MAKRTGPVGRSSHLTIEFDAGDYERAHGRAPRGHGGWMFAHPLFEAVSGARAFRVQTRRGQAPAIYANGPYGEAKRAVRNALRATFAPDRPTFVVVDVLS